MKSVRYFAAVALLTMLSPLWSLSAHADTQISAAVIAAVTDPRTEVAGSRAVEHDQSYANVSVLSAATDKFDLASLDVVWTAQNYHDLHDSFMGPANVAALNRGVPIP